MAQECRDYILERVPREATVPLKLEIDEGEWLAADAWPRQIARVVDAGARSEWVVDLRRFGDRLQIRAVEYAADGMWMPHVWRDLPRGAAVFFRPGEGLSIRGTDAPAVRRVG